MTETASQQTVDLYHQLLYELAAAIPSLIHLDPLPMQVAKLDDLITRIEGDINNASSPA